MKASIDLEPIFITAKYGDIAVEVRKMDDEGVDEGVDSRVGGDVDDSGVVDVHVSEVRALSCSDSAEDGRVHQVGDDEGVAAGDRVHC